MPDKLDKYDQIYYKNDNPPRIKQANLNKMEDKIIMRYSKDGTVTDL